MAQSSESRPQPRIVCDDLDALLDVLPPRIRIPLREQNHRADLLEVVMDLGREPEARYPGREVILSDEPVSNEDLAYVIERIGAFGEDNRAGIERTLHRISAIRNRAGRVVGLTARVGRAVFGTIDIIRDIVETGHSILLLGRPGVGKTTMLREMARVLAEDLRKRVIVVDTSNEIAGDGDIPHPAIGRARRMQVPTPTAQHAIMIEAVENHMPEVIVIDEIGTELEAMAARTIAERGVQLIGTAHGNTLENLMMNPTLADLIGGIQSVTLSDEEARRRGTQKSILERKAPPTFNVMVEIINRDEVAVHRDVAATVDMVLRGAPVRSERRRRIDDGEVEITTSEEARRDPMLQSRASNQAASSSRGDGQREIVDIRSRQTGRDTDTKERALSPDDPETAAPVTPLIPKGRGTEEKPLRIYPFGVSRNRLENAIAQLRMPAVIVRDIRDADLVMTLKNYYRQRPQPLREAENRGTSVYVLRSNTAIQMEHVLSSLLPASARRPREDEQEHPVGTRNDRGDLVSAAMVEAEEAIGAIIDGSPPISLAPQDSYVRRLQHQLADRYNLSSRSRGKEPYRRVEIYR